MTRTRLRAIQSLAPRASERKARALYEEVYGAVPAPSVPIDRVRASLVEATEELLHGKP